jgi:AcrR family transcriptional regulator
MAIEPALSRSERKTAANREAIIDAAQALLDEGGLAALTIPAVSERADVAVQTIYNRIGSRDALLLAVAQRALEANRVYMDEAYAAPGTPLERIQRAATAYAQFAAERPAQFRLLADPPNEPDAVEPIAKLIQRQNQELASAIREGISSGCIRADIDPDRTATTLWATCNGILALAWRNDALRTDPNTLLPLLSTIIEDGIAAPP